jgi:hypothetical protein
MRSVVILTLLLGLPSLAYTQEENSLETTKARMPASWPTVLDATSPEPKESFYSLMAAIPWEMMRVDSNLILITDKGVADTHKSLYFTNNKMVALYLPDSRSFHVDLTILNGQRFKSVWYSPRTGKKWVGGYYQSNDCQLIVPPGDDECWNWVVLIGNSPKQ